MVRRTMLTLLLSANTLGALEKLPEDMMVHYGDPSAPVKILEYMEVECPSCQLFFEREFENLKMELVDSGKASYTFHLNPNTLLSVQLLLCIHDLGSQRSEEQRAVFERVMSNVSRESVRTIREYMRAALQDNGLESDYISDNPEDVMSHPMITAFVEYLKQGGIPDVPTLEIDGKVLPGVPSAGEIYNLVGVSLYNKSRGAGL